MRRARAATRCQHATATHCALLLGPYTPHALCSITSFELLTPHVLFTRGINVLRAHPLCFRSVHKLVKQHVCCHAPHSHLSTFYGSR